MGKSSEKILTMIIMGIIGLVGVFLLKSNPSEETFGTFITIGFIVAVIMIIAGSGIWRILFDLFSALYKGVGPASTLSKFIVLVFSISYGLFAFILLGGFAGLAPFSIFVDFWGNIFKITIITIGFFLLLFVLKIVVRPIDHPKTRVNQSNGRKYLKYDNDRLRKMTKPEMDRLIDNDPANPFLHADAGGVLQARNQYQDSITYLLKAVELDPNNAWNHLQLAFSYSEIGEYQLAIDHHQKATILNPTQLDYRVWLANALYKNGKIEEAITEYRKLFPYYEPFMHKITPWASSTFTSGHRLCGVDLQDKRTGMKLATLEYYS